MSSQRQDFHKLVHDNIDAFVKNIRKFAAQKDIQAAYDALPEDLTEQRTFEEVILDDLLDGFAITMADVPEEELPVDVFHRLLNASEGKTLSQADAKADLLKSTEIARTRDNKDYFPDFIEILSEIAPDSEVEKIGHEWISLVDSFATLPITDGLFRSVKNARIVTENTEILLSSYETNTSVSREAVNENVQPLLKGPSSAPTFIAQELSNLLFSAAKEVSLADLPATHGRDADVNNIVGVLLRKDAPHIALHGEEGVGKGAVIQAVAKLLAEGRGPGHMKKGRIFSVSLEELAFKGGAYVDTAKQLINLTAKHNKTHPGDPIILYINDYGLSSPAVAGPMALMRAHMNFELKNSWGAMVIAEMTDMQMITLEKSDPESMKKFQKVSIAELAPSPTADQLKIEAEKLQRHHKMTITDDAINHIIRKTTRYMPTMSHPKKDIDVIIAAAALGELNGEQTLSRKSIDLSISKIANLPPSLVGGEISERIDNLENNLNKLIFGQEHATKIIADTISLANQGLLNPKKPLGTFLLLGPTGVGKTALAKALSLCLFDDEDAMVRVNFNELQEKHTVSRITGAPPGYVGYGEATMLDAIKKKPFCVTLIDEVEKAHPDLDNPMMSVYDEGELQVSNGEKLNFRNSVIILTSNSGEAAAEAEKAKPSYGFHTPNNESDAKKIKEDSLKARFTPEYRNRLTTIQLNPLSPATVEKVTLKEVEKVSQLLRDNQLYAGVKIELTPNALAELMAVGYDAKMGARPMERAIGTMLTVPLSKWLRTNQDSLLSSEFKMVVSGLKAGLDVNVIYPTSPEQDNNKPSAPQVA